VFVECFEGSDEVSSILEDDSHPVVDELNHLVVLADCLLQQSHELDWITLSFDVLTILDVLSICPLLRIQENHAKQDRL
jgi:hypothetical protein